MVNRRAKRNQRGINRTRQKIRQKRPTTAIDDMFRPRANRLSNQLTGEVVRRSPTWYAHIQTARTCPQPFSKLAHLRYA